MQVDFDISMDDLATFNQYHGMHQSRMAKCSYWVSIAILPAMSLLILYLLTPENPTLLYWVVCFLVPLALLFYSPRLYQSGLRKMMIRAMISGDNRGTFGHHTISIDENGLNERTEVNNSHWSWFGIETIEQTDDYIYIYISSLMAHIIPKRAFTNAEQADEFFSSAEIFLARCKAQPVSGVNPEQDLQSITGKNASLG